MRCGSCSNRNLPEDLVIATGKSHTVREFLELAACIAEVDWKSCVENDPRYFRPSEVNALEGDASKARQVLGWRPETSFEELVQTMVKHDLDLARQEQTLILAGHRIVPRGHAHA